MGMKICSHTDLFFFLNKTFCFIAILICDGAEVPYETIVTILVHYFTAFRCLTEDMNPKYFYFNVKKKYFI